MCPGIKNPLKSKINNLFKNKDETKQIIMIEKVILKEEFTRITENNRLLVEFMRYKLHHKNLYKTPHYELQQSSNMGEVIWSDLYTIAEMKFHSSWDWLMPVVEKIESFTQIRGYYRVDFFKFEDSDSDYNANIYEITNEGRNFVVGNDNFYKSRIEATYRACIEFVKWWNKKQLDLIKK